MKTDDYLSLETSFNLLSLRDLLAAREQFHLHLSHKPNVVATAVGRYRIRKTDPWPDKDNPKEDNLSAKVPHSPRTLENSEIRPYSWPAILVFVAKWVDVKDFAHPEDAIPPAVYMPNGQKVPICVVQVEKDDIRPEGYANYNYPASMMGGGYPVYCNVQGQEHFGSVACLVSDGHKVFALTNRHVAGEAGSVINAIIGKNMQRVGVSAPLALTRKLFEDIYPGWQGRNIYVDLDVGLIEIDDLQRWTTQVYGVGEIGPLADLDVSNISLKLIGCSVKAHGAASGAMQGEICALFYRFNSVGGFDYVADLLIGPRGNKELGTHPGDSGTLWLIENTQEPGDTLPRPIAMQWGGQVFLEGEKKGTSYALATLLSTVCNELDVTLLRGWNTGLPDYWGAVGHYTIAGMASDVIQNKNLKTLMKNNVERISFKFQDVSKKNLKGLSKREFVPLADVPDMVWKVGPFKRGGMTSPEHANHFADMDRELDPPIAEGATLLEICKNKLHNVSVEVWQRYYDAVEEQFPAEHESRGLLPFRVWQIYDAMVDAVRNGNVEEFVCAAGILSHYVGDSCQPLHISYLFNGNPDKLVAGMVRNKKTGKKTKGKVPTGQGVHAAYEDIMIDRHVPELVSGINGRLARSSKKSNVSGGQEAAYAVIQLMQQTFKAIPPTKIIAEFVKVLDEKPAARADSLWKKLGANTINVMADGCQCLALLWDSAWEEGGGDRTIKSLDTLDEEVLSDLYQDRNFLPSHNLNTIGSLLEGEGGSSEVNAEYETEEETET